MGRLDFWYDFASTYSYLSAMRIERLAADAGVDVVWKPFLLGPIFAAQGWTTSPFNLVPAKGRYMIRDIERTARERGLDFRMPEVFPQNSVMAARLAIAIGEHDPMLVPAFTKAVFAAEFGHGRSITDRAALEPIMQSAGLDFARFFARIAVPDLKQRLQAETASAAAHGIFGAPTFRTADGDLFWGDDRLQLAVSLARHL